LVDLKEFALLNIAFKLVALVIPILILSTPPLLNKTVNLNILEGLHLIHSNYDI
jgi:hypothetical protein